MRAYSSRQTNREDAWVIASLLAGLTARQVYRRGATGPDGAEHRGTHGSNLRPDVGRTIDRECGGRRRSSRARRRWVFLEHDSTAMRLWTSSCHLATPGRWRGIQLRRQVPEDRKWKRSVPLCTGTPPPAFHGWLVGGRQADCRRTYRHTLEPSRWPTLPRSWRRFALGRRRGAGEFTLEFACTLSCAKPTPRPGRPPTIS